MLKSVKVCKALVLAVSLATSSDILALTKTSTVEEIQAVLTNACNHAAAARNAYHNVFHILNSNGNYLTALNQLDKAKAEIRTAYPMALDVIQAKLSTSVQKEEAQKIGFDLKTIESAHIKSATQYNLPILVQ